MDRPKNSRVRHGMASCARYGCKRETCLEAQRRATRENYHGQKDGGARVSCSEVTPYVVKLVNAGMSVVDISDRSGVSPTQVRLIFRSKLERVHRVTAEAILGIPFPEGGRFPDTDGLTDATGARRRLQALTVQGFSVALMAEEGDMQTRTISAIRSGLREQVRVSRLRAIVVMHDALYDADPQEMGLAPSASTRARQWAAEQGWWPTEAWADIDDPDCKPNLKTPRYVILTENYRELSAVQGYDKRDAADRLGVTVGTLDKAVRYYDAKAS